MAYETGQTTKRYPDTAYMLQQAEANKRLTSQIDKSNGALREVTDVNKLVLTMLEKNTDLLKEQLELSKLQRPQGKTYEMALTLAVGSKLAHIDFIAGNKNNMSIVPAGANIEFPFAKLYSLTITNDGPATIVYSTNKARGSNEADSRLFANETKDLGTWPFPTFETLNVALESGSTTAASLRITGLA